MIIFSFIIFIKIYYKKKKMENKSETHTNAVVLDVNFRTPRMRHILRKFIGVDDLIDIFYSYLGMSRSDELYHFVMNGNLYTWINTPRYEFNTMVGKKLYGKLRRIISNAIMLSSSCEYFGSTRANYAKRREVSYDDWSDDETAICSGWDCNHCNPETDRDRQEVVVSDLVKQFSTRDLKAIRHLFINS